MESKLIENDPMFVVTSSQRPGETQQSLKTHPHDQMKYFIDVEEGQSQRSLQLSFKTHGERQKASSHLVQWSVKQREQSKRQRTKA